MIKDRRKTYIKNCTGQERANGAVASSRGMFSRVIFYFLTLCFAGVTIFVLFFSPYLAITNIAVQGTSDLDPQMLRSTIESSQQGKFLNLIPKNNFLLIRTGPLENMLKDDFKKIRSVSVSKKFPDTLQISIEERQALMVWCSSDQCYLIDESGKAYMPADFNSPQIVQNNLVKIADNSNTTVSVDDDVLDDAHIQYVLKIKDALRGLGFNAAEYYMPSRVAGEIDVKTDQGIGIYFSSDFPLDSAINAFALVLKKQISNDQKNNLEYVDLRSENRVFYKFKGLVAQDGQTDADAQNQITQSQPLNSKK
ncbi:MAG TPA: FtsQ-type POTRA domain-containing protein [Patescibacteria group bacterium]